MSITAKDIEAEHLAALASLTPAQHRALARQRNAKQATHFAGGHIQDALQAIFVREAVQRSEQLAQSQPRTVRRHAA